MLRASSFCQRRSERTLNVRLQVDPSKGTCDDDATDDPGPSTSCHAWASHALLRAASLIQGQFVWIVCQKRRIVVEIRLGREPEATSTDSTVSHYLVVHLSKLAAANLGLFANCPSGDVEANLTPCRQAPVVAEQVSLRHFACPPKTSVGTRSDDIDAADAAPPEEEDSWPLPPAETVLLPNTILPVARVDGELVWYQVVLVNTSRDTSCRYTATDRTIYSLEAPSFAPCPRLPPLTRIKPPPHANLNELTRFIHCLRVSRPAECVLQLIGTNELHHTNVVVQSAASQSGRRLVALSRGWAVHSYRTNGGKLSSNGGLMDKLNGLAAALVQAKQCIPSLLHVTWDATEFSSHDEAQFHDEQSRIWSILMEHLSPCDYRSACHDPCRVPPIVVVLSTAAPLQRGPLLESLVFEPLQASMPDAEYIRYLWNDIVQSDVLDWQETMTTVLSGRSAGDIALLRKQFLREFNTLQQDNIDPVALLNELSKQLDVKRRSGLARIPQVQWSDVGGLHSVRREILDTIELPLQYPHLFSGRRSGILLHGPPGSGKTLVAKAVATECNLPFLSVKGPELLGSYVGESEENVRTVFAQARQLAKNNKIPACILFFDELDSLAPRRGDQASGGGSVMDRVVATLFAEMDRNESDAAVYCLGATNRPDLLDPALLRPGRLDRLVYLGMATPEDQVKILAAQMHKLRLDRDAMEMARKAVDHIPGNLSGADLSTIVSKALMRATERLCDEADAELARREDGDDITSLDQILGAWDEQRLTPVVTLEDMQWASQHVVPSVSEEELKSYERLRDQFQASVPSR